MTHQPNTIPEAAFPSTVVLEGPCQDPYTGNPILRGHKVHYVELGLSKREYFAAEAMKALIHVQVRTSQAQTAETAYEWADAMLKASGK